MRVADVMQRPVYSATPTTSAREVAVNLLMSRSSGFPIVDQSGALVGIVTELDLIRALRAGKNLEVTLAAEIMTPDVITVDAEAQTVTFEFENKPYTFTDYIAKKREWPERS